MWRLSYAHQGEVNHANDTWGGIPLLPRRKLVEVGEPRKFIMVTRNAAGTRKKKQETEDTDENDQKMMKLRFCSTCSLGSELN
ncbi:MAG: hypothetical protein ACJAZW_000838 [Maritalea sp.]|jgi:hypothetical protein